MKTRFIPKLIQNVSLTLGISDEEYNVLKNCSSGENSISDIVAITKFNWNDVVKILKTYEKKGWIKIDYEGEKPEFQPISIKKFPETAVRLGMISKKKYDINLLCDGNLTIREIAEKLDSSYDKIVEILNDMKKNKIVEIYPKIPLEETPETRDKEEIEKKIIKPVCVKNISPYSDLDDNTKLILQSCDGEKTIEDIYANIRLPFPQIVKTIIEYEEKGWITLKLDQYMKLVELKNKIKNISDDNLIREEYEKLFGTIIEISDEKESALEMTISDIDNKEVIKVRIKSELPKLPNPVIDIIVDKILLLKTNKERDELIKRILSSENASKFKFLATSPTPTPAPDPTSYPSQSTLVAAPIPQEPRVDVQPQAAPTPIEDQDMRLNTILNIINELSQRIINSIVSLIDAEGTGTILYQTNDWDIKNDISKFLINWKGSAPSITIGGIKYATIKIIPNDIFIATNVQGHGHILAKYLNPLTIIMVKMPREQDPLDVEDLLPNFITRINSVFSS